MKKINTLFIVISLISCGGRELSMHSGEEGGAAGPGYNSVATNSKDDECALSQDSQAFEEHLFSEKKTFTAVYSLFHSLDEESKEESKLEEPNVPCYPEQRKDTRLLRKAKEIRVMHKGIKAFKESKEDNEKFEGLRDAIINKDINRIEEILSSQDTTTFINLRDLDGFSLLHYLGMPNLSKKGKEGLLGRGSGVTQGSFEPNRYALEYAEVYSEQSVQDSYFDNNCAKLLLTNKANVNSSDSGITPVFLATLFDKFDVASTLISHGADVTLPSYFDGTKPIWGSTMLTAELFAGKGFQLSGNILHAWLLPSPIQSLCYQNWPNSYSVSDRMGEKERKFAFLKKVSYLLPYLLYDRNKPNKGTNASGLIPPKLTPLQYHMTLLSGFSDLIESNESILKRITELQERQEELLKSVSNRSKSKEYSEEEKKEARQTYVQNGIELQELKTQYYTALNVADREIRQTLKTIGVVDAKRKLLKSTCKEIMKSTSLPNVLVSEILEFDSSVYSLTYRLEQRDVSYDFFGVHKEGVVQDLDLNEKALYEHFYRTEKSVAISKEPLVEQGRSFAIVNPAPIKAFIFQIAKHATIELAREKGGSQEKNAKKRVVILINKDVREDFENALNTAITTGIKKEAKEKLQKSKQKGCSIS